MKIVFYIICNSFNFFICSTKRFEFHPASGAIGLSMTAKAYFYFNRNFGLRLNQMEAHFWFEPILPRTLGKIFNLIIWFL
jgi:hypothetical protein